MAANSNLDDSERSEPQELRLRICARLNERRRTAWVEVILISDNELKGTVTVGVVSKLGVMDTETETVNGGVRKVEESLIVTLEMDGRGRGIFYRDGGMAFVRLIKFILHFLEEEMVAP